LFNVGEFHHRTIALAKHHKAGTTYTAIGVIKTGPHNHINETIAVHIPGTADGEATDVFSRYSINDKATGIARLFNGREFRHRAIGLTKHHKAGTTLVAIGGIPIGPHEHIGQTIAIHIPSTADRTTTVVIA